MQTTWDVLSCECGSTNLTRTLEIRWKPDGGLVEKPQGYWCVQCHEYVDISKAIERKQLSDKRKELAVLQEQIGKSVTGGREIG